MSLPSESDRSVNIAGQIIKTVETFTYLSSEFTAFAGSDRDVEVRMQKALKSFDMMTPIWRNFSISSSASARSIRTSRLASIFHYKNTRS